MKAYDVGGGPAAFPQRVGDRVDRVDLEQRRRTGVIGEPFGGIGRGRRGSLDGEHRNRDRAPQVADEGGIPDRGEGVRQPRVGDRRRWRQGFGIGEDLAEPAVPVGDEVVERLPRGAEAVDEDES